jgi:hypothetical protein
MISVVGPWRSSRHAWRAFGPHDCFIFAGLRPARLLAGGDVLLSGSCSFLSASRRVSVMRVTLVTSCTQTSQTRESGFSLFKKLWLKTSPTSPSLVHLRDSEEPLGLPDLLPTNAPLRPEQLCTGRPRPASTHKGRYRAAAKGVLKMLRPRALGRAIRDSETALRDHISTQDAVP